MASLGAHKDDQTHKLFLGWDGDQVPSLREAVNWGAVDGGDYSTQGVVVILASEFLERGVLVTADHIVNRREKAYHCNVHEPL